MKKFFGRFFIILGILLIIASGSLFAYNLWDSHRAESESQAVVEQLQELVDKEVKYESDRMPIYEQYPDMTMPTKVIDGYRYIGILEIPSKNLKLPVMEEWDYSRLKISPCCYAGSVYKHDIVIAGHNYLRHFTPIKSIDIGAKVIFTDMSDNEFEYEVAWTEVLEPKETEQMTSESETNPWDLTLFTCTTGGGSRFTLRCVMTDNKEAKTK